LTELVVITKFLILWKENMKISQDDIIKFRKDGVLFLPGLINKDTQEVLKTAIERDIQSPGPYYHGYEIKTGGRFHGNMRLWETDPDFEKYCLKSKLPKLAAKLTESKKINLFYGQLFVKEPGTNATTRWHNDQPYWPIKGENVLSFWLALDNVSKNTGALEFVIGSHLWGQWFQPESFAEGGATYEQNDQYVPMRDIDNERKELTIKSWNMQPGDVIAFHGLTVHGAKGNSSPKTRRRGYTVRYCGDGTCYEQRRGTHKDLHNVDLTNNDPLDSKQYPVCFSRA